MNAQVLKLRDYQQEALESVISLYKSGVSKQLIVLPTGSGKTVIMAAILKHFGTHECGSKDTSVKALVIAHRKELIQQNKTTIEKFSGISTGEYSGNKKDLKHNIISGSVQSCSVYKALNKLEEENFQILVIDEAHHSNAKSYKRIIDKLGFDKSSPKLLLGFTATPNLFHGNNLLDVYDEIAYSKNIDDMIDSKYISDIIGRRIETLVILDGVKIISGDYSVSKLSNVINTQSRNRFIVNKYKYHVTDELSQKATSIAFCATISHAKNLSKEFNKAGIKSDYITGNTGKIERSKILKKLKNRRIEVVTSVGVLTEGFDMPEINTIIMARPTKSRSLYIQMIGRGLRIHKSKTKCLVLDFTDEDHSLRQTIRLQSIIKKVDYKTDIKYGDRTNIPLHLMRDYNEASFKELCDMEFDIINGINKEQLEDFKNKTLKKKERSLRASMRKLKLGEFPGKVPLGYIQVKGRKKNNNRNTFSNVIIDTEASEVVKKIFKFKSLGLYSNANIASKINEMYGHLSSTKKPLQKSVINSILKNKFYIGIMTYMGIEYKHRYEAIVSEELFNKVKAKKKLHKVISMSKSEQVKKAIKVNLENGKLIGRVPFGYTSTKATNWRKRNYKISIDPINSKIVKQMFKLYALGSHSISSIAELNKDNEAPNSKQAISNILRNKFYIGIIDYNGTEYSHKYETIIAKSLFNKVQRVFNK